MKHRGGDFVINARNCIGAVLVLLALSVRVQAEDAVPTSIAVSPSQTSLFLNGSQSYTATVYDQFGAAIDSAVVTWDATGGTISSTGVYTAGTTPGNYTVTATAGSVQGSVSVTILNQAPVIQSVGFTTPEGNSLYVLGTAATLNVSATDDDGEANLAYSWTIIGPAPVSLGDNGTNSAKDTTATFGLDGNYFFTVTVVDAQGTATSATITLLVLSMATTVVVSPPHASMMEYSPANPPLFTASVTDQFGHTIQNPGIEWSTDGGMSYSDFQYFPLGPGEYTVTAICVFARGTAALTVNDLPPTFWLANGPTDVYGTLQYFSVSAMDYEPLHYLWTSSGPGTVTFSPNGDSSSAYTMATFSAAGDYVLTVVVTDTFGLSATTNFTVHVHQSIGSASISPQSVTIPLGGSQIFTASAGDQFGNPITTPPFWLVDGSIFGPSTNFTYTGTTPGSHGVETLYINQFDNRFYQFGASADVTVTNSPPVITSLSAPTVVTGTTATFSITATDDGGEPNLTYDWYGWNMSFSDNSSNSAKNVTATFYQAGSYCVQVMVRDPYFQSTIQSFTVTVVQTPQITITAVYNGSPIPVFGQVNYVASAVDQFGQAIAGPPTWTATGGTINNNGQYFAGSVGGTFSVTATFGSASANVPIVVIPGKITATVVNPGSNVNLTTEGTTDWAHWGLTFDHKANVVSFIGQSLQLINASAFSKTISSPTFAWTDGTPTASGSGNKNCVSVSGNGSGFQFTVQATTAVQTLNIYVGVAKATGKLQLSLSDNSAPVLIDTSITSSSTTVNKVYQVQFSSPYAATLSVNWTEQSGGNNGSVLLQAATLKQ
jgi:hypothetical protein